MNASANSTSVASRKTPTEIAIAPRNRVARIAGIKVVGEKWRHPLRHAQRHQHRHRQRLGRATAPAFERRRRGPVGIGTGCRCVTLQQHLRYAADDTVFIDIAHRHVRKARIGSQGRCQTRGEQGMPAQVGKEVGSTANRLTGKQLAQCRKQRCLSRILRHIGFRRFGADGRQWPCLECFSIDFPRCETGHLCHRLEHAGHHIRRQAFRSSAARSPAAETVS